MTRPPFASLKVALSVVLLATLFASASVFWSRNLSDSAELALQQQRNALQAAQQRLNQGQVQQQLIATHQSAYQALAERGFIGPEHRLAWIEAAQQANHDAGLYGLDYRLAPRTATPAIRAQGLPLGQTVMTLTLPLLLETDLPRFLAALKTRAPGVYHVRGCNLTRLSSSAFEATHQPRLQAECELLWFTVANPEGAAS